MRYIKGTMTRGIRTALLLVVMVVIFNSFTLYNNQIGVHSLTDVVYSVQDSVVQIIVDSEYTHWSGSGVLISNDGLILTAGHVVRYVDVNNITVVFRNGIKVKAVDVYAEDKNITDCGLIRINVNNVNLKKIDPCKFGRIAVGGKVFAIGQPHGLFQSVSLGIISALNVNFDYFGEKDLLQTDCPLNPGSSGCPMFNMKGRIIAICVGGIPQGHSIGFCVPADVCKLVIKKYITSRALGKVITSKVYSEESLCTD